MNKLKYKFLNFGHLSKRKSIIQIERNESYSIKIYITRKVSLENTLKSAEIILLHSRTFVTAI